VKRPRASVVAASLDPFNSLKRTTTSGTGGPVVQSITVPEMSVGREVMCQ
jgi:hypothetical protein